MTVAVSEWAAATVWSSGCGRRDDGRDVGVGGGDGLVVGVRLP
jgi:hypothetical protein